MRRGWRFWGWAGACVATIVIAAAARILGAINDLWLDEILAIRTACSVPSVAKIFTGLHSELNHHLYTLYLYLLPPDTNPFDCRIPSLMAGVGTVVLAGLIGRRRSRACGLIALVLFGSSYVMVLYSSEARGYALAVFFALAAFHLLDRHLETSGWPLAAGCPRSHAPRGNAVVPTLRVARADAERREANGSHAERGNQNSVTLAAAFSLCSILGFLSQLTFVSFYFATLVWSLYRLRRESKRRPSPPAGDHCRLGTPPDCNRGAFLAKRGFLNGIAVRTMLCCHAAPLLFLAAFYLIDIRHITGISGTPSSLLRSSIAVPAWALGSPSQAAAQIAGCAAAIAILVAGIWLLRGQRPDLCIFFPVAIVVFPVLLVAIRGSDVIYVRYFIIAIALLLLLFSFVLARLYERGPLGKAACATLLVLFVALNGLHAAKLFEYGRGRYSEAIRYITDHSQRLPTTIGGNQDFRVGTVLAFYDRADEIATYFPQNAWPPQGPEWLICNTESFDDPVPPAPLIVDQRRNQYEFVKSFPCAPLSGLHWFLYRNRR